MKKNALLLLFLALFITIGVRAQENHIGTLEKMPDHPRILMLKGEEKALLKKIKQDSYWKEIHAITLAEANKILSLPPSERTMEGRRLLGVSRENLRRIFFLSYAYRLTGDKKYALRAEQEMLKVASFKDWNPSHFLDVGEMTMAMAIGYDWTFDKLSTPSKTIIKQAIIDKGLKPSLGNSWWVSTSNNWAQVCHAGMAYGALAIYEDEPKLASNILNRAIDKVKIPMRQYAPDGVYPEGIGYWEYGTSFNVMFLSAIEKVYGTDFGLSKAAGFMKTGQYSQQMLTPSLNGFCYSDNGAGKQGFNSTVFWFYSKTGDPTLLYMQKKAYETSGKRLGTDRLFPACIIWGAGSGASLANPTEPTQLTWKGEGVNPVAVFRTSWSDPNALYLGFKMGQANISHGHMDAGSFFVEADGVKWCTDLGMENYNSLETKGVQIWGSQRWDVFRYNNFVHNVLTINDKLHNVKGEATIDKFGNEPDMMYVTADLSKVYEGYAKNVQRGVALIDKKYILVDDIIDTPAQFTKVTWNIATAAEKITFTSDKTALLESGDKKMYMIVDAPAPIRFYNKAAESKNTYDTPNKNKRLVGFDIDLPAKKKSRIKVYLVPRNEMNAFRVNSVL